MNRHQTLFGNNIGERERVREGERERELESWRERERKTMDGKLIYISNDDKQNYPF